MAEDFRKKLWAAAGVNVPPPTGALRKGWIRNVFDVKYGVTPAPTDGAGISKKIKHVPRLSALPSHALDLPPRPKTSFDENFTGLHRVPALKSFLADQARAREAEGLSKSAAASASSTPSPSKQNKLGRTALPSVGAKRASPVKAAVAMTDADVEAKRAQRDEFFQIYHDLYDRMGARSRAQLTPPDNLRASGQLEAATPRSVFLERCDAFRIKPNPIILRQPMRRAIILSSSGITDRCHTTR
jgi:hypothetical protein